MGLQVPGPPDDILVMRKWQTEDEMNAELRRIAHEMRQLKEELRSYIAGASTYHYGAVLPSEEDRRLRRVEDNE